ncbi:unnamed protein product [Cunninghamella blakesleeana]
MGDSTILPVNSKSPSPIPSTKSAVLDHENGLHLEIAVIESTLLVTKHNDKKKNPHGSALTISVFNVILEDKKQNRSLVRYIKDFIEFDQKVKSSYKKCKLSLPILKEPQLRLFTPKKKRGVRGLLLSLNSLRYQSPSTSRSNSEKIEIYLRKCAFDPYISQSTLFRDFLSPQRDEDRMAPVHLVRSLVYQHEHQQQLESLQHQHQQQQQQESRLLHDSILIGTETTSQDNRTQNNESFLLDNNLNDITNYNKSILEKSILPMENPLARAMATPTRGEASTSTSPSLLSLRRKSSWLSLERQRRLAGSDSLLRRHLNHDLDDDDIDDINDQRRGSVTSLTSVSSISSLHSIARSESQVYYHHQHQQQFQNSENDIDINIDNDIENNSSSHATNNQSNNSSHHNSKASIQDFQFIKVLGKGCMGKVLLVRHQRTHKLLALKAIRKGVVIEQNETAHIKTERDILAMIASIRHPFLIKLHHAFQDANQLFLVLDYYGGGDLANQLARYQRFTPERSRLYTAEILLGLQELHRLGILYRDLKPENILLASDGHIILTDFGLSKQFGIGTNFDDQRTGTFCGTAEYLAPEILQGLSYNYSVDLWSLGTILYEMLVGLPPFWAKTHAEMYNRVLRDPLEFPEDLDEATVDFITGLLQRTPSDRLGTGEDGPRLIRSHPYFECLEWTDVFYKRIRPPYIPRLRSETDFSHFDREFLEMTPRLSPTLSHEKLSSQYDLAFQGYSYTNSDSNVMSLHDDIYYSTNNSSGNNNNNNGSTNGGGENYRGDNDRVSSSEITSTTTSDIQRSVLYPASYHYSNSIMDENENREVYSDSDIQPSDFYNRSQSRSQSINTNTNTNNNNNNNSNNNNNMYNFGFRYNHHSNGDDDGDDKPWSSYDSLKDDD